MAALAEIPKLLHKTKIGRQCQSKSWVDAIYPFVDTDSGNSFFQMGTTQIHFSGVNVKSLKWHSRGVKWDTSASNCTSSRWNVGWYMSTCRDRWFKIQWKMLDKELEEAFLHLFRYSRSNERGIPRIQSNVLWWSSNL